MTQITEKDYAIALQRIRSTGLEHASHQEKWNALRETFPLSPHWYITSITDRLHADLMPKRMRLQTDRRGHVTLTYRDQWSGDVIEREFMRPIGGIYVREKVGTEWRQVCDALAPTGPTLTCEADQDLADVIRQEYRRMKRRTN